MRNPGNPGNQGNQSQTLQLLGQFLNHTSILIQTFMLASLLYTVVDDHSKE
jgi:hypothetical protein